MAIPYDSNITIFETLAQYPVYLSEDHVLQNVIPAVLGTIVAVSSCFCLAFPLVVDRLIPQREDDTALKERRKFAYQATNLITNTVLGLMGIYFYFFVLPPDLPAERRIQGWQDFYILGAIQIGFQIWSIAVGLLWVGESPEMLVHHVAVIFAASKSVFLTNGFRYYAPLALGLTELSSVPLSIMNSFKNNTSWQQAFPQCYLASRLSFSLCFLVIRIGLFVPQHLEYLQYAFLINYHAETEHVGATYRALMSISWLGAVFLLWLQFYWGYLIVTGLSKFALTKVQIKSRFVEKKQV